MQYNLKEKFSVMINFKKFNNIISLTSYFTSDEKCKQAIVESRWGVGNEQDVVCPYCGKHHCKMSKNGRFHCTECNKNFSCLVGTIFENTKLPLIKWFVAMYLISSHKKGISSHQLSRDLSVTQSTAWYMLQKVRFSTLRVMLTLLRALWSVMRCISVARRSGSTSQCVHPKLKVVLRKPRHLSSV